MRRFVSLVVSVLLVVGAFVGSAPSSAGAADRRGTLGVVCVDRDSHVVRAPGSGSCRSGEKRVVVRVDDRLRVCAGSGSVRALGEGACRRKGGRSAIVPGNAPAWFCAARPGGTLRAVPGPGACRRGERALESVNHQPGAATMAGGSVSEDAPVGSPVGSLAATDPDLRDQLALGLVDGAADNDLFALDGSSLVTAAPLDFETAATHSVAVRVRDLLGQESVAELTVVVVDANDAPTAISLSPAAVAENAGATTVGTLGVLDQDQGDTHTFTLVPGAGDADNASFAIAGDRLSSLASFDFEKQPAYSVRVRVADAAGASYEQAVAVAVTDVDEQVGGGGTPPPPPPPPNEAPTNLALSSSSVVENQPAGTTVGTLSADDAAGDILTYALVAGAGSDDNASFAIVGTALRTAASFDFETDASYTVRVRVSDNGTPALSAERAFTIDVTDEANVAPSAVDDSYTGIVGNTRATLGVTPAPAGPNLALTGALPLVNDTDPDAGDVLAVVPATGVTTTEGGTVTIDADGSFTYLPQAGDRSTVGVTLTDSFDYVVTDGEDDATATITLEFSTRRVWYVDDDAAAGGDGRSTAPFDSLDLVATDGSPDPDRQNDQIFVFGGSYPMTLPLDLMGGQQLLGAGVGLPDLGVPAGTAPLISRATGTGSVVVLANSSLVDGVAVEAGGTLNAVVVSGGTGDTTVGPAATLRGVGTAPVVLVSGAGLGDVTIAAPVIAAGTGRPVNVNSRAGGTITFSGSVQTDTPAANGISLVDNAAAVRFTGGLTIATTGSNREALSASNGGMLTVTGAANTLTTGSSTALTVQGVTIGADGLTFRSITSAGAPSGIVLEHTGSVAGLTVTGSSAGTCGAANGDNADCTGGTIANSTAAGIRLLDTSSPTFTRLRVTGSLGDGILAADVTGRLTVQNSAVQDSGADGVDISSLSGPSAFSVTGNRITRAFGSAVLVTGSGGTGTLSGWISNNAIGSGTALSCSTTGHGVEVRNTSGTAVLTVGVVNNVIRSCSGSGIRIVAAGGAPINATLTANTGSGSGADGIYAGFGSPADPPADSCLAASANTLSGAADPFQDLYVESAYALRMPSVLPDATTALEGANPGARVETLTTNMGAFVPGVCLMPA